MQGEASMKQVLQVNKGRKRKQARPSSLSPKTNSNVSAHPCQFPFRWDLGRQVSMALQPHEVWGVALLFRESEVFLKQSCRLVHSSGMNFLYLFFLFFFKLTVIPCSCHIASWERCPPEQRGRYEVWELCTNESTFSCVAVARRRMHRQNGGH